MVKNISKECGNAYVILQKNNNVILAKQLYL